MGNSPRGLRLLSNGDCSYRVQLGRFAAIFLTERKVDRTRLGEFRERWEAIYTVDGSTCALTIIKHQSDRWNPKIRDFEECLLILLNDGICESDDLVSSVRVDRLEGGVIEVSTSMLSSSEKTSKTANAMGGVTEQSVHLSVNGGRRKSLLVIERKKRSSSDIYPYMVTVAHYLAASDGYVYLKNEIGLSVVVKIQVVDDGRPHLDFTVDGPVEHPASALFYMFDEVYRTGIWKPNACGHCGKNSVTQKQRRMLWQSESEDSCDNLPVPGPHNRGQNAGAGVLGNDGVIKGNHNGNLIVKQLLYRGS